MYGGTSLDYLNNRYHDPVLGTFISVDPLVATTAEAYIYASGNPVTYSDPTGLCTLGLPCPVDLFDEAWDALVGVDNWFQEAQAELEREIAEAIALQIELRAAELKAEADAVRDRGCTVVVYEFESWRRRLKNPPQTAFDNLTGTTFVEHVAALEAIVVDDAEITRIGPYCGEEAECLTAADTLGGYEATTVGHTQRYQSRQVPDPGLTAHETQHTYDVEQLGMGTFVALDGVTKALCRCYRESFNEAPAYRIGPSAYPGGGEPRGLFTSGRLWQRRVW